MPARRYAPRPSHLAQVPARGRFALLLVALVILGGIGAPPVPALAAPIGVAVVVNDTADTTGGTTCTLRDALTKVNTPASPAGGCTTTLTNTADSLITFALPGNAPWTILLGSVAPTVTVGLTITGPGSGNLTIRRDTSNLSQFRLLNFSTPAPIAISGVTLAGGYATDGTGGALRQQGTGALTVTGSIFNGNTTSSSGGGFGTEGTATVTGSTFIGNSAASAGGGFYAIGTATVTGTTLTNNAVTGDGSGGGFFTAGTAMVTGSTFTGNTIAGNAPGGGFFAVNTATVENSTFTNNTIAGNANGGGFFTNSGATVTNSTFTSNTATAGGGVFTNSGATVTGSTFASNTARTGGGGGLYANGATTVETSTFRSNTATVGGGIYATGTPIITGSTLTTNTATGGPGGGLFTTSAPTVTGSTFTSNTANAQGGGFYTNNTAMVETSTFSGNTAAGGGGFYTGIATVTDSTFRSNTVTSGNSGAGFYSQGGGWVERSTFSGNTAQFGGGFYTSGAAMVTSSTFSGNTAQSGGGFYSNNTATVSGNTFSGNTAISQGSGFYARSSAIVVNSLFAQGTSGVNCFAGGGSTDQGGVVSSDATCANTVSGSLRNTDPKLGPLADNGGLTQTHGLLVNSPARGFGVATDCQIRNTDQRGVSRPATGCDSGAYQSAAQTIVLTPATLPSGTLNAPYGQTLTASGGTAPYTFAVTAGALPGGLSLTPGGVLNGTVSAAGDFTFIVTATDSLGVIGNRAYSLTISKIAQTITFGTPASTPAYTVGQTFTVGATASSGLAVTFAASGPCTLSGTTVTTTGAGDCTITASQPGDATYQAAPAVARIFTVVAPQPGQAVVAVSAVGGSVSPSGVTSFPLGTVATFTATSDSGRIFTGWTLDGTYVGFANPLTITLNTNHILVANFARPPAFNDVPTSGAQAEAITQLAARGIIDGYPDGNYYPTDNVNRAQAAVLLARALGLDTGQPVADAPFSDIGGEIPEFRRAIALLAARGIAKGYDDGTYNPTGAVTHAQAISLITRSMVNAGYWQAVTAAEDDGSIYPNIPASSPHRLDILTFVKYAGAIPDRPTGQAWVDWEGPSSRGWTAQVLWAAYRAQFSTDRVP